MSEPIIINAQAFQPFNGGRGKRLTVTTSSATAAIPGGQQDGTDRVLVTNGGSVSAFVCLGPSTVAAITEAGSTKIQATAGRGT